MIKRNFLDILFWIILIFLVVYALGKLTGLLSPEWADILPILGIVFAAGILYQKLISFMNIMDRRTNYLKNNLDKLGDKIDNTSERTFGLINNMDKRVFYLEKQQNLFLRPKKSGIRK